MVISFEDMVAWLLGPEQPYCAEGQSDSSYSNQKSGNSGDSDPDIRLNSMTHSPNEFVYYLVRERRPRHLGFDVPESSARQEAV